MKENVKYAKWNPQNKVIKNGIKQVLALDFAKAKSFTEIWNYVHRKSICTKITLCVYLEDMVKSGEIERIKQEKKKRKLYVLADQKFWIQMQEKYEKRMRFDIKRMQKETNKIIKKIESGKITREMIKGYVLFSLTAFEKRRLNGIDLLLQGKQIEAIISPAIVEDFMTTPFNLMVQLIWTSYEKYPKETMQAIDVLKKRKEEILKPWSV